MDYSFDGTKIIIGDNRGNISLINEHTEKVVKEFQAASWFNNGHSNRVFSLKFLNDNHNMFVSGGWDGMIFLWDIRENKPVNHITGPKISGDSLDYKNGKLLACSYENENPIKIFDLKKMEKLKDVKTYFNNEVF